MIVDKNRGGEGHNKGVEEGDEGRGRWREKREGEGEEGGGGRGGSSFCFDWFSRYNTLINENCRCRPEPPRTTHSDFNAAHDTSVDHRRPGSRLLINLVAARGPEVNPLLPNIYSILGPELEKLRYTLYTYYTHPRIHGTIQVDAGGERLPEPFIKLL